MNSDESKKTAKWGCLTWVLIIIIVPIILIIGLLFYIMERTNDFN
ncbi:hypothetical protein [Bacillus aquiflavi]|nr:hypothetical protein [Bacillus aquiflavi]